jgi:CheY-like chemotaxis protein
LKNKNWHHKKLLIADADSVSVYLLSQMLKVTGLAIRSCKSILIYDNYLNTINNWDLLLFNLNLSNFDEYLAIASVLAPTSPKIISTAVNPRICPETHRLIMNNSFGDYLLIPFSEKDISIQFSRYFD